MNRDTKRGEELNELFHNCAVAAYAEAMQVGKQGDAEHVRRRAYELYEANKNGGQDATQKNPEGTDPHR